MQIITLQSLKILTILKNYLNIMKEYHKKFNSLNNLKPRTKDNEKLKQGVLTNVGDIYNELYDIYKSKYSKKIDKLSAKDKKKLDYKKLRLSDNYQYSSEEEQEGQEKTKTDSNEFNKQIIDEETDLNEELFKKLFSFQKPSDMLMYLNKTKDKTKNNELVK